MFRRQLRRWQWWNRISIYIQLNYNIRLTACWMEISYRRSISLWLNVFISWLWAKFSYNRNWCHLSEWCWWSSLEACSFSFHNPHSTRAFIIKYRTYCSTYYMRNIIQYQIHDSVRWSKRRCRARRKAEKKNNWETRRKNTFAKNEWKKVCLLLT